MFSFARGSLVYGYAAYQSAFPTRERGWSPMGRKRLFKVIIFVIMLTAVLILLAWIAPKAM
jgi:hypothetical protein